MGNIRVKISLELVGDSTDAESIKECVYNYLIELINDDSLAFDVEETQK